MDPLHVHPAQVREEHEVIVSAAREEMLNEVAVLGLVRLAGAHADDPLATALLGPVAGDIGPLDEPVVGQGDDDPLVGDQVLDGHFAFVGDDLGHARRGVLFLQLAQLLLDDGKHAGLLGENVQKVLDPLDELGVLGLDLVDFEAGELVQAKFQDGVNLTLGQRVAARSIQTFVAADEDAPTLHLGAGPFKGQQLDARLVAGLGTADDPDELIEVVQGANVALEQLGALLGLTQLEAGATQHDLAAMLDIALDDFLEVQRLRLAVVDGQGIHAERGLQLGVLEKVVDDHARAGIAFQFDHQTAVLVGFIPHRRDFGDDFFLNEPGDLLFEPGPIHVVRNLGNDQLLAVAFDFLDPDAAPQLDAASAGLEVVVDALDATNEAAGREIRTFDELRQLRDGDRRIVDLGANAINDLTQIVGSHVGGHADRDARAAIDEQVGERRRKNRWLHETLVVVGNEIDRVPVHVRHQGRAQMGQARLGITHGRRRVVFHRTEVPLAVHQLLTHGPRLRHVDQSRIDHRFAVRVVIT